MSFQTYYPDFSKTDTLLKIGDVYFPKTTSRGLEQSIEEQVAGRLVGAADGGLLFLGAFPAGDARNIRFTTRISSSQDRHLPPLGFIRAGIVYPVECVCWIPADGMGRVAPATFLRKHVPGSIAYFTFEMDALPSDGYGNLDDPAQEPLIAWTYYRPILACKLLSKTVGSYSPWEKRTSWSLEMREHKPLAKD